MSEFDLDTDEGLEKPAGKKSTRQGLEPGKVAGTNNYGEGGPGVAPPVPGKRAATDLLPADLESEASSDEAVAIGEHAGAGGYGRGRGGGTTTGTASRAGGGRTARPGPVDIMVEPEDNPDAGRSSDTTVGVGEVVTLTATRAGTWRASEVGPRGQRTSRGRRYRWIAPATPGAATVTFSSGDGYPDQTIGFTVVAPHAVHFFKQGEERFPAGEVGAGFTARVAFEPFTVSFRAIQWKEEPSGPEQARGYFRSHTPPSHGRREGAGRWIPNRPNLPDMAVFGGFAAPWTSGSFMWVIPNRYRVGSSGEGQEFTRVQQTCVMDGPPHAGRLTVTKGEASAQREPGAARGRGAPRARGAAGFGLGEGGAERRGYGLGLGGDEGDAHATELASLRGHVPATWMPVVELVPADGGPLAPDVERRLKQGAYQRLIDRVAGIEAVQAYLGADPCFAAHRRALDQVNAEVLADLTPVRQIREALARLATGMVERDVHTAVLAGYVRVSPTGRRCLREQELVTGLPDGPVKQLLRGDSALVPLPEEPAADAATPGTAPAADPALDRQFEDLKQRLLREDPGEDTPATRTRRDALATDLRAADGRVLDRLRADAEASMRIAALTRLAIPGYGSSGTEYTLDLARAADSVSQLHRSLFELESEDAKYRAIKAYLEARPGPDNQPARARVMQHQPLMGVITGFTDVQQRMITRLIATGTSERTPMVILQDAAAGQVAASGALHAAIALSRAPGFQELRSDGLFRQTIESGSNRTVTTVDGVTTSAHDLILRMWGIVPTGAGDAESALPTDAVNPTAAEPPSPAELEQINALFPPTIDALASELGGILYVSDSAMVSILTDFEASCAAPDKRRIFERARMHPGIELTRRCSADARIGDLRSKIHRHVDGEQERQICERVLGIRVDSSTVGRIDGSIVLPDDERALSSGTVPLAQALRSTQVSPSHDWASGTMSLSQLVHQAAIAIKDKLNEWHLWGGCAGSEITGIYRQLSATFGGRAAPSARPDGASGEAAVARTVRQELERQTGIAHIHPIELLVNAFQTVPGGGDLAGRINERVEEADRASTLRTLGLDAAAVRERQRAAEPPPAGRFEERAQTLHAALAAAQRAERHDDQDRANETALRAAGEAWRQVRALDAAPDAGAPPAAGGAPTAPSAGADSFRGTYRRLFGIDPERHLVEVGRAASALAGTTTSMRAEIAGWLGVDPARLTAAVQTTESVDALPETTASGFTREQAVDAADRIWDGLRRGDVQPLRQQLEGRRPEERALIERAFRRLSGDVDLRFYVQQAHAFAGAPSSENRFLVGMEGVHAEGAAAGPSRATPYHESSWREALDVVETGSVGVLTRVRTALANGNRNEIFRIADEATREDRVAILGDGPTMQRLRDGLGGVDYDRVYAVLTGTADMATRLYSRSEGDVSGPVARFFSDTDTEGMRRDIREYAARRRELHLRRAEDEGRDPGAPATQARVQQAVRDDLLRAYDNPQVRAVIDQEFPSWFRSSSAHAVDSEGSELEGMLLNGGEADGLADLRTSGYASSGDILAQVRQMTPEQRQRYRSDPGMLQRVSDRSINQLNRRLILLALQSDEPAGEDHILRLVELGSSGDTTEAREQIARLSPRELARLRRQPDLVAEICQHLNPTEQTRFRALLSLDAAGAARLIGARVAPRDPSPDGTPAADASPAPGTSPAAADGTPAPTLYQLGDERHPIPGRIDEAEVQRLGALRAQCAQRILLGARNSWIRLLREAVQVFQADLKPALQPAMAETERAARTRSEPPNLAEAARRYERTLREQLWAELRTESVIREAAADNGSDLSTDGAVEQIRRAVLKEHDPSALIIGEDLHWYGNEDDDIEDTIRRASPELIISQWSSVKHGKWHGAGGESLQQVYDQFKGARQAATPQPGGTAPEGAAAAAQRWQHAFQRYVIEPSYVFEAMLLPHTTGDRTSTTRADQELDRNNTDYAKFRRALNERIRTLDTSAVAEAIGATGPDAAMLGSRLRGALTDFEVAEEIYAHHRGDGQGSFAQDEGRELDRSFGDYRRAVTRAEDAAGTGSDIDDRERRHLSHLDEGMRERASEYQAAREQAASVAATVVGTIVAVIVTALTAGAATPLTMMMYGALTSAAAASGEVLTREMVLGRTYDAAGDGLRDIATAAATGFVAAGAQYYAGRLTSGMLGGAASQAEQGRLISEMATHTPPRWQAILQAGGRTLAQQAITGLVETTGSMLSPTVWSHGWDEGWIRATQRGREELRSRPLAALRATIVAMIGASVGGGGGPDPVQPGERVGLDRTLRQIGSDMPSTVVSTAADVGIGVAAGELRSVEAAAGHFGSGVAGSVRDVGMGIHEGSVHLVEARRFSEAQLEAAPHLFQTEHERMLYRAAVESSFAQEGPPTAVEFATAREALAASIARRSPEFNQLTPAEQAQFVAWVRAAPSTAEFRLRMHQSPRFALGELAGGHAPEASGPHLDTVTRVRDELRALHERSFATEVTTGPMDGHERVGDARVDSREATRLEARARAAVEELRRQVGRAEFREAPNLEALRTDLRTAEEALREITNQASLIRLSALAAIGNATDAGHTTWVTRLEPGAPPPADATPEQAAVIREANRIFQEMSDPRDARFLGPDSARTGWAEHLQRHGIDVPGFVARDAAHDLGGTSGGAIRDTEGHPLERGRASVGDEITPHEESAILADGAEGGARGVDRGFVDRSRAAMLPGLDPGVAYAALAELVRGGAIPGVQASSGGRAVEVLVGTGASARRLRIEVLRPADTHGAVARSDFGSDPDHVHVWVSDRIREDQVARALGGIIHDVIARASGRSGDAASAAGEHGQLRAMFARLESLEATPPTPTHGDPHHVAMALGRTETTGRVRAELDLMLLDLHVVGGTAEQRAAALEGMEPTLRRMVEAHLRGPGAIRIDEAATRQTPTAPAPSAADAAVISGQASASQVLPPPPEGTIRPFTADDYPRVLELRMHFEAIRELDQRLAARDRGGSARDDASPARGESLRRREHVARAQALLAELQIGGTNQEYLRQRLAELEAVFPGSSDVTSGVQERAQRRITAVAAHQRAETFRQARRAMAARIAEQILAVAQRVTPETAGDGTPPPTRAGFTTERIIVGGGMAGTSRAAALGATPGADGHVDIATLLVLGGDDMISRWDPDEHWGQRPGVFENSDHPMYRGADEGRRLGDVVEDPGEFMHVGELNDSMDLARERLGIVPVDARVTGVQVAEPGRPWPGVAPEYVVRVTVSIGGVEVYIYTKHTDITTGLGNTGMPNEGVLDAATRERLLAAEPGATPIVMGGERLMARDAPAISGRVLVVAFGPTGAWAAARAAELGASGVDWAGTASSDMNLSAMRRAASIDRTQESFTGDGAARIRRTTDQILHIAHDGGGGAVVTFAYPGDPPRTYRVRYDHVLMTQGFDSAGGSGVRRDAPSASPPQGDSRVGTLIGGMTMQAQQGTDAMAIENAGPYAGAVTVYGGAAWDGAGVTSDRERAILAERRAAGAERLSSDSPDTRTMEAMGYDVEADIRAREAEERRRAQEAEEQRHAQEIEGLTD